MSNVNTTIESATSTVQSGVASLKGGVNQALEKEKLSKAYKLAGQTTCNMIDGVKHKANANYYDGKSKAIKLSGKAEQYVKEKPLVAAGALGAAAVVAGWAITKALKK